jgi:t-SNARE complex subunit (syntaxin)
MKNKVTQIQENARLIDDIADCLLEDHIELMQENAALRSQIVELTESLREFPDLIRNAFEEVTYPELHFAETYGIHGLKRRDTGEYVISTLEEHWQTFQKGWKEAVKCLRRHCKSTG